jgi:hypothetical protein
VGPISGPIAISRSVPPLDAAAVRNPMRESSSLPQMYSEPPAGGAVWGAAADADAAAAEDAARARAAVNEDAGKAGDADGVLRRAPAAAARATLVQAGIRA